jgi:predicted O-linked N-acetylglucosamine transferase (SPINDLY family)
MGKAGRRRAQPQIGVLQQARALHANGRLTEADALYREMLRQDPDHSEAIHLLGVLALQGGRAEEAVTLISRALSLDRRNAQAHANLGSALLHLQRPEEALEHYDQALRLDPHFTAVLYNQGNALQMLGRHEAAARAFEQLLTSMPAADFVLGNLCHSRRHCCDWRDFDLHTQDITAGVRAGRRAARPFAFLSVSASAADQLQCTRIYAAQQCPAATPGAWSGERYAHDRIRIAYVTADFRDHVVMHLMAPLFEQHDTRSFDTIGVALAGADGSKVVARARRALGQVVDVTTMTDVDASRRLRALEIDIAVDLTGYTQGARPGLFARRIAPVQVNYLGFPGTLGVPYMDYILADEFVIPDAFRAHYAEQPVYLPHTFQAIDERRGNVDLPASTRAQAGLPQTAIVLCSFNNSYKLNPGFFDVWMRVLRSAPGSVLWLLADTPAVERNLRREARSRGVAPERVIFAPRAAYDRHLARIGLADLFLDSLPFNAGATAADALWSGVPVLTCAGEAFAARMAGSLLQAAGLAQLIARDPAEYERRACELAGDPQQLTQLKAKLAELRGSSPLFDSRGFCRHLEAAYVQMWERHRRGERPSSLVVHPSPRAISA